MVRRLQADMKFSAAGETFHMKYIWQALADKKTWLACKYTEEVPENINVHLFLSYSRNIYGFVSALTGSFPFTSC